MKLYQLEQIVEQLQKYKTIKSAYRVDNNIVNIIFDKDNSYFFDMTRQNSLIFKKDNFLKTKDFNAPFDTILSKKFNDSKIKDIKILDKNRVMQIIVNSKSLYKVEQTILQLEFTGKRTNAIIIDSNDIILEALRHVDISVSYREIKPNKKLLPLLEYDIKETFEKIENIDEYLYEVYLKNSKNQLDNTKNQIKKSYQKKIDKILKKIDSLSNKDKLLEESEQLAIQANCVLANLDKINLYKKKEELFDYENNKIVVNIIPNMKSASHLANTIFQKSKKQKQKAINQHIQKSNLENKRDFYINLLSRIDNINSFDELKLYSTKTQQVSKKEKKNDNYESFFFEGHKIMVGRTEKENIFLLKDASKDDYWFHIKDMKSSHVIVKTSRQKLSDKIIQFAAKLCVDVSVNSAGDYLVDYTKRANVKPQDGANVLYVKYDTIKISKK